METIPDESTIKRILRALDLKNLPKLFVRWDKLFFGEEEPRFLNEETVLTPKVKDMFASLNESQRRAATLVCRAQDVAVIHGRELLSVHKPQKILATDVPT